MTEVNSGLVNGKFTRSAVAVALSALLPFSYGHAQEVKELAVSQANAQTEDSYKVDKSTSEKYTLPLLDTAKTITVISQSVMKDRNVDSLRDALRNVPGISMAAGEGGAPPGDSVTIRGFDASNDVFIDGIRDIAGYSRDTFNTEAVEVSKGPNSTISGRGSAGGSINMQTKTAKLEDFADVSARIGTEDDYRLTADINTKLGNQTALRINLLKDDGDVAGRDHVNNETKAIAASLMSQLTADSSLTVNADYQKQDNMPDYGLPWVRSSISEGPLAEYAGGAPNADFSNFYGSVYRDFEKIDAKSVTLKYENQLSQSTKLIAKARTGSVDRAMVVTPPRFIDAATSTDVRYSDVKTRDTRNSADIFQVDLQGTYQLGGLTHNVVAGLELSNEKFERWGLVALEADNLAVRSGDDLIHNDLYDPNPYAEYTGRYGRDGSKTYAKGDGKAVYVVDNIELNSQWIVGLGLRWDDFETKYHNDSDDLSTSLDTSSSTLSWNTNLSYKPAANGTVYLALANAFTPLSTNLTGGTRGNQADLDPEENFSIELGTKWELFNGKALVNAAIFRNTKTDGQYQSVDDSNLYSLDGEQEVTGFELGINGQVTDALSVTAAYTYQDSEVKMAPAEENIGVTLSRAPKNSASVWGRYDFNQQLAAGLGLEYVGKRTNGDSATSSQAASYTLLDMMVSYQVTEQLALRLNGTNLTDKAYIDKLGGGHFVPGNGRLVTLSASYSF